MHLRRGTEKCASLVGPALPPAVARLYAHAHSHSATAIVAYHLGVVADESLPENCNWLLDYMWSAQCPVPFFSFLRVFFTIDEDDPIITFIREARTQRFYAFDE